MLRKNFKPTQVLGPVAGLALLGALAMTLASDQSLDKRYIAADRPLSALSVAAPLVVTGEILRYTAWSMSMSWIDW